MEVTWQRLFLFCDIIKSYFLCCHFGQDRLAVNKCALMARHWHLLKEGSTGVPPTGRGLARLQYDDQRNNLL